MKPLGLDFFSASLAQLGPFEDKVSIASAISGGADSMALAHFLYRWVQEKKGRLLLLHVDHGLRPHSTKEATWLKETLARRLPEAEFVCLPWEGIKPGHAIQARAREARYRLLSDYCRQRNFLHLVLAHHRDDQQETVSMRTRHGSSIYGMAGMSALRLFRGVRLLRPLLDVPKRALREFLLLENVPWLEDPSNESLSFERARLRQEDHAIGSDAIRAWGQERIADEKRECRAAAEKILLKPEGYFEFLDLNRKEISDMARVLARLSLCLSGKTYLPSTEALCEMLRTCHGTKRIAAFGQCLWQWQGNSLRIARESAHCIPIAVSGNRFSWDHRFECLVESSVEDLEVRALGRKGQIILAGNRHLKEIPFLVRASLPSLWRGDRILCVPALNWGEGLQYRFRGAAPITPALFTLALAGTVTI